MLDGSHSTLLVPELLKTIQFASADFEIEG